MPLRISYVGARGVETPDRVPVTRKKKANKRTKKAANLQTHRGVRQIAGHAALVIKSTTFDQLLLWWATRRFTTCCTPSFVHRCPERFTLSWITTR